MGHLEFIIYISVFLLLTVGHAIYWAIKHKNSSSSDYITAAIVVFSLAMCWPVIILAAILISPAIIIYFVIKKLT